MPVERDFVADLSFLVVNPRIRRMRQHLALEIRFHVLAQRHVLGVAQTGIRQWLVFALALGAENDFALGVPLRPLDRDGAVAEIFVLENATDGHAVLRHLFEIAENPRDFLNVFGTQFLALAAETFPHLLPEAAGVNQLHLALARFRFPVADNPDISADAGVVKHIGRQADDGLDQVVFQNVAADFALAAARAAGEQRRAIEHDAEPAAAVLGRTHLGNQMQQKQERAIADARQAGTEPAIESLLGKFLADDGFDFFPFHAERRIGEAVVKSFPMQTIGGKRVAENNVGDVLPLDEHVGLANGVGFWIQLLPIHDEPGTGIQAGKMFARDA